MSHFMKLGNNVKKFAVEHNGEELNCHVFSGDVATTVEPYGSGEVTDFEILESFRVFNTLKIHEPEWKFTEIQ